MILATTESQAQLHIDVFPSQDDPTKTLWLFNARNDYSPQSPSGRAFYGSAIRSSGNFHPRDSWKTSSFYGTIYTANKPTNALFNLTPLFSSTNHPKDIESVTKRIPGAPPFGPFSTNRFTSFTNTDVTNTPTMTTGNATKTIGKIFMNAAAQSEIGIRGAGGGNLAYTNGQTFGWFGSGVLNKPITDFELTTVSSSHSFPTDFGNTVRPYFYRGGISLRIYNRAIPEPEEYALVFGLFALAFVIFRKYKVQQDGKRKQS